MTAISSRLMSHILFILTRKSLYPSSSVFVLFRLSLVHSLSISYSLCEIVLIFALHIVLGRITNARNELVPTFVGSSIAHGNGKCIIAWFRRIFYKCATLASCSIIRDFFLSAQFADVSALKSRALCTTATNRWKIKTAKDEKEKIRKEKQQRMLQGSYVKNDEFI